MVGAYFPDRRTTAKIWDNFSFGKFTLHIVISSFSRASQSSKENVNMKKYILFKHE